MGLKLHHITKSQQFERQDLEELFKLADIMQKVVRMGGANILRGKKMITLFYEPSSRTRGSFESAMYNLGGSVISFDHAGDFSSAAKGESLIDSIRVFQAYGDIIVLRHTEEGSAEAAAAVSTKPVINAGDGPGQHPTQALLDVYTIYKEIGDIDGITIALVGDLKHGRTVHSLAYLLSKFKVGKLIFVAPEVVKMRDDIKEHLDEHRIRFEERDDLHRVALEADIIYQTRIQKERFGERVADFETAYGRYIIDKEILSLMKTNSAILHPLPRVNEIAPEVDSDPRAAYFRQAENGLYIRMALLKAILAPDIEL